jgi:hypothetical protein
MDTVQKSASKSDQPSDPRPSLGTTIYLFRCGESGLYAFTSDRKGRVLPSRLYPRMLWRFAQIVTLPLNKSSPGEKMFSAILDGIERHGFHLIHAALDEELLAFTAPGENKGP